MDGVLWIGRRNLEGVAELCAAIRGAGAAFVLATNNSTRPPEHWAGRMAELGVTVPVEHVLTSGLATAAALGAELPPGSAVYVIGEEGLVGALEAVGLRVVVDALAHVGAVVVGYDRALTYAKLRDAALLLQGDALFVGSNGDTSFPSEHGPLPGAGATLAALAAATGRVPRVFGKPERPLYDLACARLDLPPERMAAVGDRLDTDIVGAKRAGLATVLVTTGIDAAAGRGDHATAGHADPDLVVADLHDLARRIGRAAVQPS